ncbi:MAG: cellulase family glycosylhydrolase [Candidatus Omnitrophica bacterium]|nr:cellulase family glycosylhydrolase [Candidatus Omnitrophota bacterium]
MKRQMPWLEVRGKDIVDKRGKKVFLRGVNLGSWLMLEGYFFRGRNFAAHIFKRNFIRQNSARELEEFLSLYRQNFITCRDIRRIKKMGANCLRIPFNYRLLAYEGRWDYLNRVISWCKKEKIWCIIDMHAAPGAQNHDWHSDSDGRARFWREKKYQKLYLSLWRKIARRYSNEPTVAGYDILNEAVIDNDKLLSRLYNQAIRAIREVDQRHIIFLEGNCYGQKLSFLGKAKGKNIAYSIHVYLPLSFTFNLQPQLKYPGKVDGLYWDKKRVYNYIAGYARQAKRWQVPIYVGEFGINYRSPKDFGELHYLEDVLQCFNKFGFHWTYWSYKCVAHNVFPDGIWQYLPDPAWVRRAGPIYGWENFYGLWKKNKKQIATSWKTEKYAENKHISRLLTKYLK